MGVHGNAEKIVREYGFSPGTANSTLKGGGGASSLAKANIKADEAVLALDEFLTTEGMVRIYALLKSAMQTTSPKFDIGEGGKALVKAMEKSLEPSKQDKETLAKIEGMRKELDVLQKTVTDRTSQSMSSS